MHVCFDRFLVVVGGGCGSGDGGLWIYRCFESEETKTKKIKPKQTKQNKQTNQTKPPHPLKKKERTQTIQSMSC